MDEGFNWNAVLEQWPRPFFVIDRDWRLVFINKAGDSISPEPPKSLEDILNPDSMSVTSLLRNAGPPPARPVEVWITTVKGEQGLLTAVGLPEDGLIALELRLSDKKTISDQERMAGVIQRIRALGHDMAQPLTVILGQAEMLTLTHGQDGELIRRLTAIITEAEKLELIARKISETIHQAGKG